MQLANTARIARKELAGIFSSPAAFIFLSVFLLVTLFIFFWADPFFARNLADVRPMFEWMPVLLAFLVPALTMRMWSEERRAGTIEVLFTAPVSNLEMVAGKFVCSLAVVAVALLLTLPLPISESLLLGQLDWGPVIGGYIASLFLAAAYSAISLYVSSRTDNQVISLILSTLICGCFLMVGSDALTGFFSTGTSEFMKLLGTGSRFQSVTRGVIDLRDLYYYLSLTGIFLSLNVLGLETVRWAGNPESAKHRLHIGVTALLIANFAVGNFWLEHVGWARADLTDGKLFTISAVTRDYLARLQEPLLIRGYFSKRTHPLLAPLVPELRDLLKEYAMAGHGKVRVEVIDPVEHPDLEREAGEQYGIKPVPFQTASKYQTALTNSYFHVLVRYGDQYETLGFRDLVEVKAVNGSSFVAELKDPEYEITNAIKKVEKSYQSAGNLFSGIDHPVALTVYVSADERLPQPLQRLKNILAETATGWQKEYSGKLKVDFVDPEADQGQTARQININYGFRPIAFSSSDPRTFWFYMLMKSDNQLVQVALPAEVSKKALERSLKAALKHFSSGFLETVGISLPDSAGSSQSGQPANNSAPYSMLCAKLTESYSVQNVSLSRGEVPPNINVLLVIAPRLLKDRQLFAIDQFLMRGGTVVITTAPFAGTTNGSLSAKSIDSGLDKWLQYQGIDIQQAMVLDPHNFPLPIPVRRNLNGYNVTEMKFLPYPYFVDVREDGMSKSDNICAGLNQVLIAFASPLLAESDANKQRKVIRLLSSSPQSWTSKSIGMEPSYNATQRLGFPEGHDTGSKLLAVAVEGSFTSYFKDKELPLDQLAAEDSHEALAEQFNAPMKTEKQHFISALNKSPDSAHLIVFASNSFLSNDILRLASASLGSEYFNPIQLLENTIDWSVQDKELFAIRGRSHFTRTLSPTDRQFQLFFEYLNYALAVAGLAVVLLLSKQWQRYQRKQNENLLQKIGINKTLQEAQV